MFKKIISIFICAFIMTSYITIPPDVSYASENVYTKVYDFSNTPADFSNVFVHRGDSTGTQTVSDGVLNLTPGYRGNWYTWHKEGYLSGGDGNDTTSLIYNCSKAEISYDFTFTALQGSGNIFMEQFYYNSSSTLPLIKINTSGYVYVGSSSSYSAKVSAGKASNFKRVIDFENGEINTYISDTLIHTYTGEINSIIRSYVEVGKTFTSNVVVDNYTVKRTHKPSVILSFDSEAEPAKDISQIYKPLKFSLRSIADDAILVLSGSDDGKKFTKIDIVSNDVDTIYADVSLFKYYKLSVVNNDGSSVAESNILDTNFPSTSEYHISTDFSSTSSNVNYDNSIVADYDSPLLLKSLYMGSNSFESMVGIQKYEQLSGTSFGTLYSQGANFVFENFAAERNLFVQNLYDSDDSAMDTIYPMVTNDGKLVFSNDTNNILKILETNVIYAVSLIVNLEDNIQYLFIDGVYIGNSQIYQNLPYETRGVTISCKSASKTYIDNLYLKKIKIQNCKATNISHGLKRENVVGSVRIANDTSERNVNLFCAIYDNNNKLTELYCNDAYLPAGSLEKDFTFECGKAEAGELLNFMFIDKETLQPLSEKYTFTLSNVVNITDEKVYEKDSTYASLLKNKFAIHMASGNVFANNMKTTDLPLPYYENGEYMVPSNAIELAFGKDVSVNEDENIISIGSVATLSVNSDILLKSGGTEVSLLAAPGMIDDVLYLPLKAIAEQVFGKKVSLVNVDVNNGMLVVSDTAFSVASSRAQDLSNYLFFDRPTPQKILSDYKASTTYGEHPRLMLTDELTNKIKAESKVSGSYKKTWRSRLMDRANQLTTQTADGTAVVEYVFPDGLRLLNECEKFKGYMMILGLAYNLTGDGSYARTAWKHIKTVSEFPDWNPRHHLDVGSMSAGFAIAYDWMYDYWSEEQKLIMENAIYKHCFYVASQGYKGAADGLGGITLQHNHNFFCNGGVSMAALAFMDVYPEISSSLVSDAVRLVELVIKTLAPNGASEEGPGYTSIISDNMSKMYASIDTALGNLYNIDISEGLSDIVPFFYYIQSDVTGFNYSECDDGSQPFSSAGLLWLCSHYDIKGFKDVIAKAKAFRYNYNEELVPLLLWYEPGSESEEAKLSLDKFYPRYSLVTMRNSFNTNQVFVGLKGGETVSSIFNSHMDQGSFVFDALGQRWVNDLGKDDYGLPGYNDRLNTRWNIFRLRSEGHNTITINPDLKPGFVVKSKADVTDFISGDTKSKAVVDMSEVLADHVTSAKRGFLFTDNRTSLVVRDEINLKEKSDIYWIMYTKATATSDGNKVTLTKSNKTVTIDFVSSHAGEIIIESAAPMSTAPVVSGQSQNSGYKRIIYKVNAAGSANITAKFTPVGAADDSDVTDVSAYNNAISTWKVN